MLEFLSHEIGRFHRRLGGYGVNQRGKRAVDFGDLSFPVGFPSRYHDLRGF